MDYKISEGIPEASLPEWLRNAAKKLGTFKNGHVNYKNADRAPIVMCTVIYEKKILLLRRSHSVGDAKGYWSTVNGFIDEVKPIKEQVKQEVKEELSLDIEDNQISIGESYTLENPKEIRKYIVFPCLVRLPSKPEIILDHECQVPHFLDNFVRNFKATVS